MRFRDEPGELFVNLWSVKIERARGSRLYASIETFALKNITTRSFINRIGSTTIQDPKNCLIFLKELSRVKVLLKH